MEARNGCLWESKMALSASPKAPARSLRGPACCPSVSGLLGGPLDACIRVNSPVSDDIHRVIVCEPGRSVGPLPRAQQAGRGDSGRKKGEKHDRQKDRPESGESDADIQGSQKTFTP